MQRHRPPSKPTARPNPRTDTFFESPRADQSTAYSADIYGRPTATVGLTRSPQLQAWEPLDGALPQAEPTPKSDPRYEPEPTDDSAEWMSAFSTSLLTTKAATTRNKINEMAYLMKSPEFEAILAAAKSLSRRLNISKEEATERLISTFRKADEAWASLVVTEGLKALIDGK